MRYTIIVAGNHTSLVEEVKRAILQGWEPIGGPAFSASNDIFQAMVKRGP